MRTLSIVLLAALTFSSTQFTSATAEESGGGPKLPTIRVCGTLEEPNATSGSTTLRPTHIRESRRVQYQLDDKSIDTVQLADHLVGDRVCLEGQQSGNTLRSARVVAD